MKKIFDDIFGYVKDIEIIDTHEHLPAFENLRIKDTDILKEYLSHYINSDLISAGLSINDYEKVINNKLPITERWELVEPYWNFVRNTGYGRALDISVQGLYGVEKICKSTIEELNNKFLESLKPGWFKKVLKEKSKIKVSLLHTFMGEDGKTVFDNKLECDKNFFRSVYPIDNLIYLQNAEEIRKIEKESEVTICSFDDWLEACEKMLMDALKNGAVGLKSALAYERTLLYEKVSKNEAEEDFNKIFKYFSQSKRTGKYLQKVFLAGKKFQDYMMHFLLRLANKKNITFQIHTGILEGNGNYLFNSNPSLLTNLFLEYPNVDFDIFHMGYPYQHILSAIAKSFPNVFIDMCWAHIISPNASINALIEWIDTVPINKISAFGGDYLFIDGVYGHQYLARINISKALAIKVEEGIIDIERAKEMSEMLFYKNPYKIFKLEGKI